MWFQTLPATQSMPYACLLRTGATSSLRHSRVLSETIHGNALLYLLLYGGEPGGESCFKSFFILSYSKSSSYLGDCVKIVFFYQVTGCLLILYG